jgi:hypothetical protein
MPRPEKQWWEERVRWRMCGPQDEDELRGRPLYRCIVDYDPLADDDEDCQPNDLPYAFGIASCTYSRSSSCSC